MNAQYYLPGLARLSLQAGVLVLLVLLAQGIFRRHLTARWRCALWMLVIVRLLLPFSPGSAASIFNLMPPLANHTSHYAPTTFAPATAAPAALPIVANPTLETPGLATQPAQPSESARALTPVPEPFQAPLSPPNTSTVPAVVKPPSVAATSWLTVLFWAWLAGAMLLTGYIVATSLRLAWRCRGLPALTDASTLAVLDECGRRLRVRGRLTVVECAEVASPALFGLFRPRLLLPPGFNQSFSPSELRFVFLHELAHLRRGDLPLNWLVAVLQILHWFNPLVWFGFARWRLDRELACDALAIEAAGADQHREYGRTILHLLENLTPRTPIPGLVGILEDKRQLRRRIGMIANFRPGNRWRLSSVALLLVLALVGLTDAQDKRSAGDNSKDQAKVVASHGTPSSSTNLSQARPVVTNGPVMKVVVLDAENGQPLPKAEVFAPNHAAFWGWPDNPPRWTTDGNGVALIHLGEPASGHLQQKSWFTVSVRHDGYGPRGLSWSASNKDVRPEMPREVTVRLDHGLAVGGTVTDEQGKPVEGVRVRVYGTGYWQGLPHEYSEFWSEPNDSALPVTDSAGRWAVKDFPRDLGIVRIVLIRPDGTSQRFVQEGETDPREQGEPVHLAALRAGNAKFVLKTGLEVHGLVLDPAGKPLPGVLIKSGSGFGNMKRAAELHSDATGRFTLHHLSQRQMILTAYPSNFAITSTIVDLAPDASEIRLQVAPLSPLHLLALDQAGRGVAGVKLNVDSYRSEGQVLDFEGTTDQNGTWTWTNAPASYFAISATLPPKLRQKIRVTPEARTVTFKLREGVEQEIIVTGRVNDASTRSPVKLDSVNYQSSDREGFRWSGEVSDSGFRLTVPATRFRPGGMYPSLQLQLEAEGYATLITPWRDFDEGDWDGDFVLRPASESRITVLGADGKPAGGARLWVRMDDKDPPLFCHGPGIYSGERLFQAQADKDGNCVIPSIPDESRVVFTHLDGLFSATVAELKPAHEVRLKPSGTVEGRVLVAGQPKAGVSLNLASLTSSPSLGLHLSYSATSDAEGRFAFTQVTEGEYKLYRWTSKGSGRAVTETYQQPVTVRGGETIRLDYYTPGRVVVGRAVPDKPEIAVNWQNDVHVLSLKLPGSRVASRVNLEDFATIAAFRKASEASPASNPTPGARAYPLVFEADGSFRADDVPPGTYEVRVRVTKPGESLRPMPFGDGEAIGSLVREVVVPEGKEPLDLGTLTVAVKADAGVKPSASVGMDFVALTLDGKSFRLADQRGKFVVLIFWASGSQRSREALADLKKLEVELPPGERVEFVGANLDDDPATARAAVELGRWPWTQTHLDQATRPKLTAAWDVKELPAIFLLNGDARVVARDLDAERLRLALRRASVMK